MQVRRVSVVMLVSIVLAAAGAVSADDWCPRVKSYELDVRFYPEEARMEGKAVVRFVPETPPGPNAIFYLHGELRVDSLSLNGRSIDFESEQQFYNYEYSLIATNCRFPLSRADLDQPLVVFYSGYFHPSQASSPSNYMRIDHDGVLLRSYGYSLWYPTFLADAQDIYPLDFTRVTIRTPKEFRSVFVGSRTSEYEEGETRVSEWTASDISPFAAQCTAQRFVVTSEGDYFLYHYDDPTSTDAAKEILTFAVRVNKLFDTYYRHGAEGGQFHIMEMPQYGDISSGNVTGLQASSWQAFMSDSRRKRHLAHELVHPFVSVPVDRSDSLWSVAIEGFPSYFHLPVLAEIQGSDWYNEHMARTEQYYLEQRETGLNWRGQPLPKEIPLLCISDDLMSTYKDEFVLSDRILLFLNYLCARMGKETFFAFAGDMLNRDRLTAASFRQLIEQYLPGSSADVHLWLETSDYPERLRFVHFKMKP